ncbi:wd repeat sam and u-box domain-containing protein [Anaeramoeba flamelloides]|uniref:Wd repeat sam and u-box domain-containing protein n=1 Tax=Anaeramoeba flamelloides TaxID=1746091 RepID=A0AAV7ZA93_9EUKA|nr:wd repeat sam and u-box domain-containing protein [Anaeramoeba flamelloides]
MTNFYVTISTHPKEASELILPTNPNTTVSQLISMIKIQTKINITNLYSAEMVKLNLLSHISDEIASGETIYCYKKQNKPNVRKKFLQYPKDQLLIQTLKKPIKHEHNQNIPENEKEKDKRTKQNHVLSFYEQKKTPKGLICPLTKKLFNDPVLTKYGHTFEKIAITNHLKNSNTCPLTNKELKLDELYPNFNVKQLSQEWKQSNPKQTQTEPIVIKDPKESVITKEAIDTNKLNMTKESKISTGQKNESKPKQNEFQILIYNQETQGYEKTLLLINEKTITLTSENTITPLESDILKTDVQRVNGNLTKIKVAFLQTNENYVFDFQNQEETKDFCQTFNNHCLRLKNQTKDDSNNGNRIDNTNININEINLHENEINQINRQNNITNLQDNKINIQDNEINFQENEINRQNNTINLQDNKINPQENKINSQDEKTNTRQPLNVDTTDKKQNGSHETLSFGIFVTRDSGKRLGKGNLFLNSRFISFRDNKNNTYTDFINFVKVCIYDYKKNVYSITFQRLFQTLFFGYPLLNTKNRFQKRYKDSSNQERSKFTTFRVKIMNHEQQQQQQQLQQLQLPKQIQEHDAAFDFQDGKLQLKFLNIEIFEKVDLFQYNGKLKDKTKSKLEINGNNITIIFKDSCERDNFRFARECEMNYLNIINKITIDFNINIVDNFLTIVDDGMIQIFDKTNLVIRQNNNRDIEHKVSKTTLAIDATNPRLATLYFIGNERKPNINIFSTIENIQSLSNVFKLSESGALINFRTKIIEENIWNNLILHSLEIEFIKKKISITVYQNNQRVNTKIKVNSYWSAHTIDIKTHTVLCNLKKNKFITMQFEGEVISKYFIGKMNNMKLKYCKKN